MDQQKRFLLAFGLTMVIVTIFLLMNPPKKPVPPGPVQTTEQIITVQNDTVTISTADTESGTYTVVNSTSPAPVSQLFEEEENTLSTELYEVTFTNKGGAIKSFKLNKFTDCEQDNPKRIDLVPDDLKDGIKIYPFSISAAGESQLTQAIYLTSGPQQENGKLIIEFSGTTESNLKITRRYILSDNSYSLASETELINTGTETKELKDFRINWGPGIMKTEISKLDKRYFGPIFKVNDKKTTKQIKKKETEKKFEGSVNWILNASKYYAVVFKEKSDSEKKADGAYYYIESDYQLNIGLYYDSIILEPQKPVTLKVGSYLGPKQEKEVKKFDENLGEIASFKGIFGFLSNIFLEFMKFLYRFIPNYGIVIIIITLLFKLVFYPLTHTSMKSMKKMQEIQPILQELQKKYKDNPQLLQQETMRMYKTYGVNPFSGCLPLLIQMPIFIALYTTFGGAIELNCAPFFWWIKDLSQPDTVAT
ncbi:MAG: membrane protein insertase YidC, partial [bacterium]|nr:membrane protein insertase YidC [bacterium]